MVGVLTFWAQSCVAVAFLLSAIWKLRHHDEFLRVVESMRITGAFARILGIVVPASEFAVAVLLIVPGVVGRVGAAVAAALTVVLSATLLRRDLRAGCGCWSVANPERGPLLTRNIVLFGLACTAAFLAPAPPSAALLAVAPIGALFGVLIMEIPTILQYLVDAEGAPS